MNKEPIYETLAPGEVYILNIIDDCVEYIANIDVFTRAHESAGYYSQKNCYNRMVESLEEIT